MNNYAFCDKSVFTVTIAASGHISKIMSAYM